MKLLYLDQNYISRMAKFHLGQPRHDVFGELLQLLQQRDDIIAPPSPFHALESAESYLLPTIQEIFDKLSQGYWIKPWQEVLALQRQSNQLALQDLLTRDGSWHIYADIKLFEPLFAVPLEGHLNRRIRVMRAEVQRCLQLSTNDPLPPFADLLARLIAFRTRNQARQVKDSDILDIIMAATLRPYDPILATDRFVREALDRLGWGNHVYAGRVIDVELLKQACQRV